MRSALDLASSRNITDNNAVPSEVLFITECSPWGKLAYETVSIAFRSVVPVYWSPGTPKPDLNGWRGDWIISFKSDLILSRALLERAKKGAINFHPNPPKYRGVGGYWWALHNSDDVFGVTCHYMDERIDHGPIIATQGFPIWPEESEGSLKHRAALYSLTLLNETLNVILSGKPLAPCGAKWEQHLYTYRELALAQSAVTKPLDTRPVLDALEAITKEDLTTPTEQDEKHFTAKDRSVA
jgi:phosphoribosylglycinamide formyltransferase 1